MRRLIAIALLVFAGLTVVGCGRAEADSEPEVEEQGRNSPLNEETDEVGKVRDQVLGEN